MGKYWNGKERRFVYIPNQWMKTKTQFCNFCVGVGTPYAMHIGNYVTFISVSFIQSFIHYNADVDVDVNVKKQSQRFFFHFEKATTAKQSRQNWTAKRTVMSWTNEKKKEKTNQSPVDHIRTVTMTNERQHNNNHQRRRLINVHVSLMLCHCQLICTVCFFPFHVCSQYGPDSCETEKWNRLESKWKFCRCYFCFCFKIEYASDLKSKYKLYELNFGFSIRDSLEACLRVLAFFPIKTKTNLFIYAYFGYRKNGFWRR